MSNNFFNVKKGLNLQPISVDPVNPIEGDMQRSDGTHRAEGIWEFKDGSWQHLLTEAEVKSMAIKYSIVF